MRLVKLLLVSVVFFALNVCAQSDSPIELDKPEKLDSYGLVIAMPNLGASAYETFDPTNCNLYPSKKLKERASLVIAGVKNCNPRYGRPEKFYDIWINGKSYLVKSSDVSIRVGDISVFESMPETDRAELAEIGKRISIERRIEALDRAMADIKRVEKLGKR